MPWRYRERRPERQAHRLRRRFLTHARMARTKEGGHHPCHGSTRHRRFERRFCARCQDDEPSEATKRAVCQCRTAAVRTHAVIVVDDDDHRHHDPDDRAHDRCNHDDVRVARVACTTATVRSAYVSERWPRRERRLDAHDSGGVPCARCRRGVLRYDSRRNRDQHWDLRRGCWVAELVLVGTQEPFAGATFFATGGVVETLAPGASATWKLALSPIRTMDQPRSAVARIDTWAWASPRFASCGR